MAKRFGNWFIHHGGVEHSKNKDYWIAKNRIDTQRELVDWLAHLSEKNWITPEDMGNLVLAAADMNGDPRDWDLMPGVPAP